MAQCKWCGKSGIFLILNKSGLCSICSSQIIAEFEQKHRLFLESNSIVEKSKNPSIIASRTEFMVSLLDSLTKYENAGIEIYNIPLKKLILDCVNDSNLKLLNMLHQTFYTSKEKIDNLKSTNAKVNATNKIFEELNLFSQYFNSRGQNFSICKLRLDEIRNEFNSLTQNTSNFGENEKTVNPLKKQFEIKHTVNEAVEIIKNRRSEIEKQKDLLYRKELELVDEGKFNALNKVYEKIQGLDFADVYQKAHLLEKSEKIDAAANLYWKNIFVNGSDIPANFTRLLILLNKLNLPSEELKVAEIYLHFINESNKEEIEKRIVRIKKKLEK